MADAPSSNFYVLFCSRQFKDNFCKKFQAEFLKLQMSIYFKNVYQEGQYLRNKIQAVCFYNTQALRIINI